MAQTPAQARRRMITWVVLGTVLAVGLIAGSVVMWWHATYGAGPLAEEIRSFRPPDIFASATTTYDQQDGPCLTVRCPSAGVDFGPVQVSDPTAASAAVVRHLEAEGFTPTGDELSEWACYPQAMSRARLWCTGDFVHPEREHTHYVILEAGRTWAQLHVWVEAS